jgi:hypothetical protein
MPRTAPVTVNVAGLPSVEDAIADAVAAERRRLVTLVRATCACRSCKDGIADLLASADLTPDEPAA